MNYDSTISMSLPKLLSHWRSEPSIATNITEWRKIPPRSVSNTSFPDELHPALSEILQKKGIDNLYTHQKLAWEYCAGWIR